ncbi:unnamed protein product [Pieris macdunnoughi]|uniref:Integrase catalytic domain-containing protein n=1 Tax=Pieris macdunnoughi TaxID=345717 RepID=A0A821X7J8_9NEOP|nr:unnamed protein product [Pieris macdunnoughi]
MGFNHLQTTAYHPAANSMVERFHRQLKAAIMCHAYDDWVEALPVVLLGIRTAWKEDVGSSSAELVYGETLRLPGMFFNHSPKQVVDYSDFVSRLRNKMQELKPTPVVRHGATPVFVSKDLQTASHVFLRQDAVRKLLQAPYVGPCKVIKRGDKTFVIEFNGKVVTVSVDGVKPAFILSSPDPVSKPAVVEDRFTRSRRRVRFPDYFRP